jgi:hypothetical protein
MISNSEPKVKNSIGILLTVLGEQMGKNPNKFMGFLKKI